MSPRAGAGEGPGEGAGERPRGYHRGPGSLMREPAPAPRAQPPEPGGGRREEGGRGGRGPSLTDASQDPRAPAPETAPGRESSEGENPRPETRLRGAVWPGEGPGMGRLGGGGQSVFHTGSWALAPQRRTALLGGLGAHEICGLPQ